MTISIIDIHARARARSGDQKGLFDVSKNGNGSDDFDDDFDDSSPELEDLQIQFVSLMQRRMEAEQSPGASEEQVQAVREDVFREQMRAAFMTHELATEDDFERLWPRLRDDLLCENAASVYLQVIDAIAEELGDET